ncbi:hypothetical protein GCM10009855_23240 [Gordonia cholesterolivorans]|uniref:Secreted protein n=1 Tax=Gordonia cholesterolivorans TaxID=559625 RepID=A0ABN3HLN2_9ACTN
MWAGRTSGLPAAAASWTAACSAACVLVVGVKLSTDIRLSVELSGSALPNLSLRGSGLPLELFNYLKVESIPLNPRGCQ